jgi:hypothetical protein
MSGVTDLELDPTGVARRTLEEVARDRGPAALDDPRLLGQLLPDLMAGAEREAALVSAAASAGVGHLLIERVGRGMPSDAVIRDIALMLAQRHAFDIRACDWIVTQYARILGVPVAPATLPVTDHGIPEQRPNDTTVQPVDSPRHPTDRTRIDPGTPDGDRTPAGRRRRTGAVAAIVVVVLALLAVGGVVLFTGESAPPKTGADCLVGSWRSTSVLVRDGTVTGGGITVTYHPGGTGDGNANFTEAVNSDNGGGVVTYVASYTFDYAATAGGITYTNVDGTSTTTGPDGPQTAPVSSFGDETFSCTGDTLHVDVPDEGGSQTYARR